MNRLVSKRARLLLVLAWSVGLLFAGQAPALAGGQAAPVAQTAEVTCTVQMVPMRDGVKLATEVYMPAGSGPFPVILQRTPYNRIAPNPGTNCNVAGWQTFAQQGYVVLNQDVRGRYRSEGEFDAMRQEAKDGYDAVEWAGTQSWSTGKVGMIGGSYVGLTQWQAAIEQPPHLVAIAPHITASDYLNGWTYQGGAFDLWFDLSWTGLTLAPDTLMRRLSASGMPQEQVVQQVQDFVAEGRSKLLTDWVWQTPLTQFAGFRRNGNVAPYSDEWLARPSYDDYWATLDLETKYSRVKVPSLNTGGWYDIFQEGTVRNFQGIRSLGGTETARNGSKLVMRALCHACPANTTAGEIDFGPNNALDLPALQLRWFDFWLKGIDNGIMNEPPVRLFVMVPPDTGKQGDGFWITADQYPLPDSRLTFFYLQSNGKANTADGDGVLTMDGPGGTPDSYVYDPRDPVRTVGGQMCCQNALLPSGAFDQRVVEGRGDVLVYTSEPLTSDMAVIGPVQVKLWATSSAPDTDFTAKLVDVYLDGYAQNVSEGIIRARYRESDKDPSWITPGAVYSYTIDLGNTATVFKKGHRIRLEISSSNFPHFDRNPNTGRGFGQDAEVQNATQQILHDADHPSQVVLYVADGVRIP